MKGNDIILSSPPRGPVEEGIISGTPKPGTIMEIVPGTAPVNGRFTWRASTVTTGNARMVAILCADNLQGKLPTDAYVSGTRGRIYFPLIGEEVNVLFAPEPGTGSVSTVKIGDLLGINTSGLAVPNSSYPSTPFQSLEYITENPSQTATLVWCKRT